MGLISVWMVAFIIWMEGALASSRTPYRPPCWTISGCSSESSSMVGMTMPYPVASTCSRAERIFSYSRLAFASERMQGISPASSPISNPVCSLST